MARLRAARTLGELVSQLVVFLVIGLLGLLCLMTRHGTPTGLVLGLWLVAFSFAASLWALWARGHGEDLISSPATAHGVYARAAVELLFVLGVGLLAVVARAPEWKTILFLVAGVVSVAAILLRAWRALRCARKT